MSDLVSKKIKPSGFDCLLEEKTFFFSLSLPFIIVRLIRRMGAS